MYVLHYPTVNKQIHFFTYCLAQGVVLRHTKNFMGLNGEWFRIGIKDITAMSYLQNCLQAWFKMYKG